MQGEAKASPAVRLSAYDSCVRDFEVGAHFIYLSLHDFMVVLARRCLSLTWLYGTCHSDVYMCWLPE